VAFALALREGLVAPAQCRVLLTTVALSMAATPTVAGAGNALAGLADRRARAAKPLGGSDAAEFREEFLKIEPKEAPSDDDLAARVRMKDVVVVLGYGAIGKVVCEMLDAKLCRYVVLEADAAKADAARDLGRPVFRGDATDEAALAAYLVGDARLVVAAIADARACTAAVQALRRINPTLPILARAADATHQRRLARLRGVQAVVPSIALDSKLLSLPFGGAVLRGLGFRADDVDMLIEENRRTAFGFFDESLESSKPAEKKDEEEEEAEEDSGDGEPKTLMEEVNVVVEDEPPVARNATSVEVPAALEAAAAAADKASDYVFSDEEVSSWLVASEVVEEKPGGSLEAQRAALERITEAQKEAFLAADPGSRSNSSRVLAGVDDDACTVSDDDVAARRAENANATRAEDMTAV